MSRFHLHPQRRSKAALSALGLGTLLILSACKPAPAPSTPATAAAPAMPLEEQLMRAALPGWGPLGVQTQVKFKLEGDGEPGQATFEASAAAVAQDGDDKALLIVAGEMLEGGHPSPGVVAAYWLERRQGAWVRVAAQEPVAHVGFFGNPGEVKLVDLAPGLKGIAVQSGSCWQGYCMTALNLYAPQGQRFNLAYEGRLTEGSSGAHPGCDEALKAKPGSTLTLGPSEADFGEGCWDIDSQWRILPLPTGGTNPAAQPQPGMLEIRFTGVQASLERAPAVGTAAAQAASGSPATSLEPSAKTVEGEDDEAPQTYRVQHQPIAETQVLRFEGGAYQVVSGKNPSKGF